MKKNGRTVTSMLLINLPEAHERQSLGGLFSDFWILGRTLNTCVSLSTVAPRMLGEGDISWRWPGTTLRWSVSSHWMWGWSCLMRTTAIQLAEEANFFWNSKSRGLLDLYFEALSFKMKLYRMQWRKECRTLFMHLAMCPDHKDHKHRLYEMSKSEETTWVLSLILSRNFFSSKWSPLTRVRNQYIWNP